MTEKEIFIDSLTGNLNKKRAKQIWQKETWENVTASIQAKSIIRNKEADSLLFKALNQSNQSINVFQWKNQTVQFTNIYKRILFFACNT